MSTHNVIGGRNGVAGDATDQARALVAMLMQLHTANLEEDGLPDGYSQGVHLVLMAIGDLLDEDAAHVERLRAGGHR